MQAVAKPGSGKTFGYLLPAMSKLLSGKQDSAPCRVLVLVPTRYVRLLVLTIDERLHCWHHGLELSVLMLRVVYETGQSHHTGAELSRVASHRLSLSTTGCHE